MWCLLYPRAQEFFQWNTTWFQNRKTGFPSQILIGSKLWRNSASSRGPRAWYRDEELSFWSQAFCLWTQASHLRWASLMAQMVKKSSCSTGDFSLIPGSERYPGEGIGYPLLYSCLENPMDIGTWWAIPIGLERVRYGWETKGNQSKELPEQSFLALSNIEQLN